MINQIIAMSLGLIILAMSLDWFGAIARIALSFHTEIIANIHLEKAERWITQSIHEAGSLELIESQNNLKALGLLDPGRVKYSGGSILEIIFLTEVFDFNSNQVMSSHSPERTLWLYHCEAGLCVKNNNNRQVLVSGISDFSVNFIQKETVKINLSDGKFSVHWLIKT